MNQNITSTNKVATEDYAQCCEEYLTEIKNIIDTFGEQHFVDEIKANGCHRTAKALYEGKFSK